MSIAAQIVFLLLAVFYFLYTLSFAVYFYKASGEVFEKKIKLIHLVLIWLIPFLWILILKAIMKPGKTRNRGASGTETVNIGNWIGSFYNVFHRSSDSGTQGPDSGSAHGGHQYDPFDSSGHQSGSGHNTD